MNPPHNGTDDTAEGVRLSRRVAELKGCSRREAEQYIEGGWVRVGGQVVETPQFRVRDEPVDIDPQASLAALMPVTILLHKPPGYDAGTREVVDIKGLGKGLRGALSLVTGASHASGDRSRIIPLRKHFTRQVLCTPLESGASGLVVFTQDGRIWRRLSEDAAFIEQEYTVDIEGAVLPHQLEPLHRPDTGVRALPPVKVSIGSTSPTRTALRFAFKGDHPGLVAAWCGRAGLRVAGMRRLRIGRVPLASLPSGQWRYLLPYERF